MIKYCPVCAKEMVGGKFCITCGTFHIVWTPRICYFYLLVKDSTKEYMVCGTRLLSSEWKCVGRNSDSTMLEQLINNYKVLGYDEFRG